MHFFIVCNHRPFQCHKSQLNTFLQNTNFQKWEAAQTFMSYNDDTTTGLISSRSNISNNILKVKKPTDQRSHNRHLGLILT